MQTYRTTRCAGHGHRELTVQLAAPSSIPAAQQILIQYFEGAVAAGTTFAPGQTIRLGWATLRLCERDDGTLGVEERERAPAARWIEAIDHALADVWTQREIVSSVGLLDRIAFPGQDEAAMVADCALDADAVVMTRIDGDDLPATFSGWTLACAAEHDHGERHIVPLLAIAAQLPALVQLLALPRGVSVFAAFREAPGGRRIAPHVFLDGEERAPAPGSYLAALLAPPPDPVAPRAFPSHDYLGSFVLRGDLVVSDTRLDPPIELAFRGVPGRWHAWIRRTKDGAPVALMAVHEAHLDRARDVPQTCGGDIAAYLVDSIRRDGAVLTGDFVEDARRVDSMSTDLVRECIRFEPDFVARWGGGRVAVMMCDEAAFDPARRPPAADDAGLIGAAGCWARTSTDDNWSFYAVEHDDRFVVLRIRLTTIDGHQYLVDRKTAVLAASLGALAAPVASEARPYARVERYAVGDTLSHPKFGLGRVVSLDGPRIQVMFDIGVKTLAQAER